MERINFLLMVVLAIKYATAGNLSSLTFGETTIITEEPENHKDYAEQMKSLATKIKKLTGLQYDGSDNLNLEDRMGDVVGNENNCYSKPESRTPYVIITNGENWKTVLQTPKFIQTIAYTKCIYNDDKTPCFVNVISPNNNMTIARCVELTTTISIYVYNPSNDSASLEPIPVPVGCTCKFMKINQH